MTNIQNDKALIDIFGKWPSFHDSEIHSVLLERPSQEPPYLEMQIHLSSFGKQAMTTLRFDDVELDELAGFNAQNVIFDLEMQPKDGRIEVEISSSYGCSASFTCGQVIVKSAKKMEA